MHYPTVTARAGQTGLTDPVTFQPQHARRLLAVAAASTRVSTVTPTGEYTHDSAQLVTLVNLLEMAGPRVWARLSEGQQAVLLARKVVARRE